MSEPKEAQQNTARKIPLIPTATGVLLVICAVFAGVFFMQRNAPPDDRAHSEGIIRKVGKLYLLPTDDQPTVAEVKDKLSLQNQDFYKDAENGDYVLIYDKSKIALLYRESLDKLIKVSPVSLTPEVAGDQKQGSAVQQ